MFETKFSTNDQKFEAGFNTTERSFQADFMNGGVIVGIDGASAYELAVENGFEGTVEEWLASLKGADGQDGYTPVKGVDYFTQADIDEMVAAVKNKLIVEQWTFTLTDGAIVTKDVVME